MSPGPERTDISEVASQLAGEPVGRVTGRLSSQSEQPDPDARDVASRIAFAHRPALATKQ
jgi:hypothetical protein